MTWSAAVLAVCVLGGVARADDAPAPAAHDAEAAPDDAWAMYDEAFAALAQGKPRARQLLIDLVDMYPDHPAAWRARALLGRGDTSHERKIAHAELVLSQSLYGLVAGVELCTVVGCSKGGDELLGVAGGIGLGFGVSLLASGTVGEGEAHLYDSAVAWGWWNGFAAYNLTADAKSQALANLGGQVGGLVGAYALWHAWRPDESQIAVANSFGFWGAVLYAWYGIATNSAAVHDAVLVSDAALVLGGVVASRWRPSRGRTLMIDVGGVIGVLAGGVAVLVGNNPSDAWVGALLGAGTVGGLALAVLGTRDWDAHKPGVQVAPMAIRAPASERVGLGVGAALAF